MTLWKKIADDLGYGTIQGTHAKKRISIALKNELDYAVLSQDADRLAKATKNLKIWKEMEK